MWFKKFSIFAVIYLPLFFIAGNWLDPYAMTFGAFIVILALIITEHFYPRPKSNKYD